MRYVVAWQHLLTLVQHLHGLLVLAFMNKVHGQHRQQTAMGIAHAHHCLIKIDARLVNTTELELVHNIVICLLSIEVLSTWCIGGEWCDAVCQSLLNKVVAQVHVVLSTNGCCYVDRTCPVALCNHLKHHQVTLIQSVLSLQRDYHLIGYRVTGHHHSALTYSFLVDGYIYCICRNNVQILVCCTNPVLKYILKFERFVAELLCCFLWVLTV